MSSSPLLPISELCSSSVQDNLVADKLNKMMSDEVARVHKTEKDSVIQKIDDELKRLNETQEKTTSEIKKRVTEVQSLKDNNLVIAGAAAALKKIRETF